MTSAEITHSAAPAHATVGARIREWRAALPAAVLAASFGLYQLGDPSFWVDEALTADRIQRSHGELMGELQWAYFALIKMWSGVAGTSEVALRLPSVIAAVAAAVLLFGLARDLFDTRLGLFASVLFAVNPFVVKWSQQARGYTILLVLVIGTTWVLVRALSSQKRLMWCFYGALVALMFLWQPFSAALFIPVHVVVGLRDWRALAAIGAAAAATAPWILSAARDNESGLPTDWLEYPAPIDLARAAIELPGALGVGSALAVGGALLVRAHRRLLLSWVLLPLALVAIGSFFEPLFVDRYLIVICPAFALLGAVALARLNYRARSVTALAAATGTVAALLVWYSPDGSENWATEDWRSATAFVMERGGVVAVYPDWAEVAYTYYGGKKAKTGLILERGVIHDTRVVAYFGLNVRVLERPEANVRVLEGPEAESLASARDLRK